MRLIVLSAILISGCGQSITAPTLIAAGQSNMAMASDGVRVAGVGEMPAVPGFVSESLMRSGVFAFITPVAIPSTSLECWRVTGECFVEYVSTLPPPDGVLWWQGETDTTLCGDEADSYGARFAALIDEWRTFFGRPINFYVVELGKLPVQVYEPHLDCGASWSYKWDQVRVGQRSVAGDGVYVVDTADITNGDYHHPAYAYREIGERLAAAILSSSQRSD